MDSWTEKQIQLMKVGGNQQCNDFLQDHGVQVEKTATTPDTIREKYDTAAAELYKQVLVARVEGKPEPTELPQRVAVAGVGGPDKKIMQGFGSAPPTVGRSRNTNVKRFVWVTVPVVAAATACLWFLVPH
jgi:hypothetical protein